jgi:hypothetical protein
VSDYDVIAEFRRALKGSTDPDPANVARQVAAAVPSRMLREALARALVMLAPTIAGALRRGALNVAPRAGRNRWATARKAYDEHQLNQRVSLPGGGWKFMRDCTAEDLRQAAGMRRQHARSVIAQARRFESIADLLDKRGAQTVGDLDREDLDGLEAA